MTIELSTEKTRLRLIDSSDLNSIHTLHSLPETDEFNTLGIPSSIEETKSVIKPWVLENESTNTRIYTFAIENKIDNDFIGLFGLKLHRIQAGCAVENTGSIKVLEKAGMIREGRRRQVLPLKSGWSDNFEYAILETDERKPSTTKNKRH